MKTKQDFLKYLQERIDEYETEIPHIKKSSNTDLLKESEGALAELKHLEQIARTIYRFGVDNGLS